MTDIDAGSTKAAAVFLNVNVGSSKGYFDMKILALTLAGLAARFGISLCKRRSLAR